MSQSQGNSPVEVVDHFIADICRKDLDAAMSHVAEDCYYDNVPIGDMNTRDEMRDFLTPMLGGDGPVEFEVLRHTVTGNTVMNERVDRFHTGSGRQIELPVMGIFEVNDGLITFWRDYFDQGTFMRQIKGG
ncbi:limonene-1,2-epoxide hydrolase family protein [Candidatus Poriferisodalis sp.]|uniref:limonene-1,2-epoxide hydrolase family protein n=1 Tax=Candidatus Poriferisodalis sp. TaxID=3101277 RepID=UPI003D0E7C2E